MIPQIVNRPRLGWFLLGWLFLNLNLFSAAPMRDWRIYATDHFELLTDGSANQAELALEKLERFRAAAIRMHGEPIISRLPVRVYLLLSSREFDWMQNLGRAHYNAIGIFQPTDVDNLLVVSSLDNKESDGRTLMHECTHLLFRGYQLDWPMWLSEGFAQALETVEIRPDQAVFGNAIPFGTLYLQRRGFMPMAKMFQFSRTRDEQHTADELAQLYIQSWAVCHYLYFGISPELEPAAMGFVSDVGHGKDVTLALQERLHFTPEQLQKEVEDHLFRGRARTAGYKLPEELRNPKKPQARKAEPGEADAWLGDWAIGMDPEKAAERYRKSLAQAPGNPFGLVGLARCQSLEEKFTEAEANLGKAVIAGPNWGWAWLYLARVSDESAMRSVTNGVGVVTVPNGTFEAIRKAQELLPHHPAPMIELGRALWLKGARPQEVIDAFGKAARLDPADLKIPFELAIMLHNRGQKEQALQLLESVIARSGKGSMGLVAGQVKQRLTTNSAPIDFEEAERKLESSNK